MRSQPWLLYVVSLTSAQRYPSNYPCSKVRLSTRKENWNPLFIQNQTRQSNRWLRRDVNRKILDLTVQNLSLLSRMRIVITAKQIMTVRDPHWRATIGAKKAWKMSETQKDSNWLGTAGVEKSRKLAETRRQRGYCSEFEKWKMLLSYLHQIRERRDSLGVYLTVG